MQYLKVAIVQSDIVWHNAEKNRTNFSKKINAISEDVDVIVLPEMFSTGFSMKPQNVAETMQGETVEWMQQIASKKNCAISGSIIITENKCFYNRFLFVHPSGKIQYYDKRHLFTLAGEHKIYTAGNEKIIIDYKGWKICPLVCYDLRFPVWARNIEDYDLLLYVANWPKPRISAWDALLRARAIENMCYLVGVNRVGADTNKLEYIGHSAAFDCLGESICKNEIENEFVEVVTLDKKLITKVRKGLNFLNDRDKFTIQL
jgi:predicted amidohydrolase